MKDEITDPVGTWWIVANASGQQWIVDGTKPIKYDRWWSSDNNSYTWTPAKSHVFDDCVLPKVTFEGGPIQFEIDKDLNTTWYKE